VLTYLQKAAEGVPNRPDVQIALGSAFVKLKRWQRAEQAYAAALEIDPQSASALAGLGSVYHVGGRYREAADALLHSIALQYHQPSVHFRLGEALLELGETEAAASAYRVTLHMAPEFNRARRRLADACDRLGLGAEAETLRNEILRRTEGHEIQDS